MSDLDEPVWEDVQEKTPDELLCVQGHRLLTTGGGGVTISEANGCAVMLDQSMVRDRDTMGIAPKISNDVFGIGERPFAVDGPLLSVKPPDLLRIQAFSERTRSICRP